MVENTNQRSNNKVKGTAIAGTTLLFTFMQACGPAVQSNVELNVGDRSAVTQARATPKAVEEIINDAERCSEVEIDYENRESIRTSVTVAGKGYNLFIPATDFIAVDNKPFDARDKDNIKRVKLMAAEDITNVTVESFCYRHYMPNNVGPFENGNVVVGFVAKNETTGEYHANVKVRGGSKDDPSLQEEFLITREIENDLTSIIVPVKLGGDVVKYNYLFKRVVDNEGATSFEIYTAEPGTEGAKKAEELAIALENTLESYVENIMAFEQMEKWMGWMGKKAKKSEAKKDSRIKTDVKFSGGENTLEFVVSINEQSNLLLVEREDDARNYSIRSADKKNPLVKVGEEFESDTGKNLVMLKTDVVGTQEYFELLINPNDSNDVEIHHRETDRGEIIIGGNMIFNPDTEKFRSFKVKEGEDVKVYIQDIRPGKETYGNAIEDWIFYTIGDSSPGATRKVRNYIKGVLIEETTDGTGTNLGFNSVIGTNASIVSKVNNAWELYVKNPFSVFGDGSASLETKIPEPVEDKSIRAGVSYHKRTGAKSHRQINKYDYNEKGLDLTVGVDYEPLCGHDCDVSDVIDETGISILDDNGRMSFEESDTPYDLKYVVKDGDETFHRPLEVRAKKGMCSAVHYEPGDYDEEFCGDPALLAAAVNGDDDCKNPVYRSDHRAKCYCQENKGKCAVAVIGTVLTIVGGAILIGKAASDSNGGGSNPGMYDTTDPTNRDRE